MKYYAIAEITVTDRSWAREYVQDVTPMVERYGGRYLARTSTFERLEGDGAAPQMFLIIEWPSKEHALKFYNSEEYRPYRENRKGGSTGQFVLVAGEDINKLAKIA